MTPYIRIRSGQQYCSGVLIHPSLQPETGTTQLALTCAHIWRNGQGFNSTIQATSIIDGTDIAVCLLKHPRHAEEIPGLSTALPRIGQRVDTVGYGGNQLRTLSGRVIARPALMYSTDMRTRVQPALSVRHAAIKGDSGAPLFVDGYVAGIQSLILNPFGRSLGIATVAPVAPHLGEIQSAVKFLMR